MDLALKTTIPHPDRPKSAPHQSGRLTRLFNWFGSGGSGLNEYKANLEHAREIAFFQGRVISTQAHSGTTSPIDLAR